MEITNCLPCEALLEQITGTERMLGYWEPGNWAYVLENARRFAYPVAVRGNLGLWNFTEKLPPYELITAPMW